MAPSRNEPVIDRLLETLFNATSMAQAILDNCQDEASRLDPVHRQSLQIELDAITSALDAASN